MLKIEEAVQARFATERPPSEQALQQSLEEAVRL